MDKRGFGFRTSLILLAILVLIAYIVLNNIYVTAGDYSKNLSKSSCLKGKLNATEADTKNCMTSCASEFETKVRPVITCSGNKTVAALCQCERTVYNQYIRDLF